MGVVLSVVDTSYTEGAPPVAYDSMIAKFAPSTTVRVGDLDLVYSLTLKYALTWFYLCLLIRYLFFKMQLNNIFVYSIWLTEDLNMKQTII